MDTQLRFPGSLLRERVDTWVQVLGLQVTEWFCLSFCICNGGEPFLFNPLDCTLPGGRRSPFQCALAGSWTWNTLQVR